VVNYKILSLIFVLLLINLISAGDIAYIYSKDFRVDQNIVDQFESLGLSVDLIKSGEVSKTDFSQYRLLFVGDERFSNADQIPVNQYPSIIINYKHGGEWGLTNPNGITSLAGNSPLEVKKGSQIIQVYDRAFYQGGSSLAIPYYYIKSRNAAPGMMSVAEAYQGGSILGDAIAYGAAGTELINGKFTNGKICFFGIVESEYWTPRAREMFNDCIGFVASECSSDSDCGEGGISESYCEGNSVFQDVTSVSCENAGTIDSMCVGESSKELVEECEDACVDGACVEFVCEIDADCDDSDDYTLDVCVNPGTLQSFCENTELQCIQNSDCGSQTSELVCQQGNVYSITTNPVCSDNVCDFDEVSNLVEVCDFGCSNGICIEPECRIDADCEEDEFCNEDNECELRPVECLHSADINEDGKISQSELDKVISYFNAGGYHCDAFSSDGYASGPGNRTCKPHDSDYAPQNWKIELSEMLRLIQFKNSAGYDCEIGTEDGFIPVSKEPTPRCFSNSDCDDSDDYTLDVCVNPGTLQSFCENTELQCIVDSDCGSQTSELVCQQGNVYSITTNPVCSDNVCDFDEVSNLVEVCDFGCSNGICLEPECRIDADCEEDEFCNEDNECELRPVEPECRIDADCGFTGVISEEYCSFGNGLPKDISPIVGYSFDSSTDDRINLWGEEGELYVYNDSQKIWFDRTISINGSAGRPPKGFVPTTGYYDETREKIHLWDENRNLYVYELKTRSWGIKNNYSELRSLPQNIKPKIGYYFMANDGISRLNLWDESGDVFVFNGLDKVWYNRTDGTKTGEVGKLPKNFKPETGFASPHGGWKIYLWNSNGNLYSFNAETQKWSEIKNPLISLGAKAPTVAYYDYINDKNVLWYGKDKYVSQRGVFSGFQKDEGNQVTIDYQIASCQNSTCSVNVENRELEICDFGCSNGVCLEPECRIDADCEEDEFCNEDNECELRPVEPECRIDADCGIEPILDELVCENGKVLRETLIPKCKTGNICGTGFIREIVEYCSIGCENGACIIPPCSSNADCDDGNHLTIDTCINAGSEESYCEYNEVECVTDDDCNGNEFCNEGVCEQVLDEFEISILSGDHYEEECSIFDLTKHAVPTYIVAPENVDPGKYIFECSYGNYGNVKRSVIDLNGNYKKIADGTNQHRFSTLPAEGFSVYTPRQPTYFDMVGQNYGRKFIKEAEDEYIWEVALVNGELKFRVRRNISGKEQHVAPEPFPGSTGLGIVENNFNSPNVCPMYRVPVLPTFHYADNFLELTYGQGISKRYDWEGITCEVKKV
jgi:hypothetical protein